MLVGLIVVGLVMAAALPLMRVYIGRSFLVPVLAAALGALALSWVSRRLNSLGALVVGLTGWVVFATLLFLPETARWLVVPTQATLDEALALTDRAFMLMRLRPAPTLAEPPLVWLTASAVWFMAMAIDGLVFRARSAGKAIVVAVIGWSVPLALAPPANTAWPWALPLLATAGLLLLATSTTEGTGGPGPAGRLAPGHGRVGSGLGWALGVAAIVAGVAAASVLPGFGQMPWYQLRGRGGTTLTTNPIVNIRPSLVAQDTGPILRVASERPVYLRTTTLDVYTEGEQWTNDGIQGQPLDNGQVPGDTIDLTGVGGWIGEVNIEVVGLSDAVLVPAPSDALAVSGPAAGSFQFDDRTATFTLDRGVTLNTGDEYSVLAAGGDPSAERLNQIRRYDPGGALTALPPDVPDEVPALARRIVSQAGATTPFQQALAIQNELRSWTYSLSPGSGHSGAAMTHFIETRTGYCEQFAGTMAVMLRSLEIPARVAVGFTPGRLVSEGVWSVSNANAHAWVEVLFPGYGWTAFEPTPRSDGNVLVPSGADVSPVQLAEPPESAPEPGTDTSDGGAVAAQPGDLAARRAGQFQDSGLGTGQVAGDQPTGGSGWGWGWAAGGLALVAALGAFAAVGLYGGRDGGGSPRDAVLAARARLDRLGHGVGRPPRPHDTDREYLRRLASAVGGKPDGEPAYWERVLPDEAQRHADALARIAEQARYAKHMDEHAGLRAARHERNLRTLVMAGLPPWRRRMVGVRGASGVAKARIARALRQFANIPAVRGLTGGGSPRAWEEARPAPVEARRR